MADLNIFGLYDSRDLTNVSLADYTERLAMETIEKFRADYNAIVADYTGLLARTGTEAQRKFGSGIGGELQPYVEGGATEATRTLDEWTVGFPIYRFRDRQMYTEERLATISVEDLGKDIAAAAARDHQTMLRMLLRAALLKTNFTFADGLFPGSNLGDLAVKRLANADSAVGAVYANAQKVDLGTAQHYIGSNTASVTIAGFKSAYAKLRTAGKLGDVVALISATDEDTVRGLTEFNAKNNPLIVDPNKKYAIVQSARAIGRLEGAGISCEVIVMPFMPAAYTFMFDRSDVPPVAIRQHTLAQFQGFRLIQDETRAAYGEASLRNKRWERIAGAGVSNRFNGVAVFFTASTTYTDPTL